MKLIKMTEKQVIGLCGMPGSGKSAIAAVAREKGYSVIVMGDVVREEMKKRDLEINTENIGRIMLEMRQEGGSGIIAERCIFKIMQTPGQKVILDGVRSLSEVEEFKRRFSKLSIVAVHASPKTRFDRVHSRRRSDDSKDWEAFVKRDMRELSVGLGDVIALADCVIVNEENLEELKEKASEILQRVEHRWKR